MAAIVFVGIASGEEAPRMEQNHQLLRTTRVGRVVFDGAKFHEAFDWLKSRWKELHPDRDFPVAVTDFEFDFPHGEHETLVTLQLENPTFWNALDHLASVSRRSIRAENGLVGLETAYQTVASNPWWPELHGPSGKVLAKLGIGPGSSAEEIHAAYRRFDIRFDDWMPAEIDEKGWLVLTARRSEHHKIEGLHHLLESGFSVSRVAENSKNRENERP